MSEYGWGIVVGVVATFAFSTICALAERWLRRRAARRFAASMSRHRPGSPLGEALAAVARQAVPMPPDLEALLSEGPPGAGMLGGDMLQTILEAPEPPRASDVPEDPPDWLHVWKYVDGFAAFVGRFRSLPSVPADKPRPPLSLTTDVYEYDAVFPPYVGHPEVETWLHWFDSVVVAGFASDLTYTLDEVRDDLADCHVQLRALLERVGPPRKRSVAARLQGQINQVLDAAAKEREDRRSISKTRATFGAGSFGGDPQPGSGAMG